MSRDLPEHTCLQLVRYTHTHSHVDHILCRLKLSRRKVGSIEAEQEARDMRLKEARGEIAALQRREAVLERHADKVCPSCLQICALLFCHMVATEK